METAIKLVPPILIGVIVAIKVAACVASFFQALTPIG